MKNDLLLYRNKIDTIDDKLIKILSERFKIVNKIGKLKNVNNLAIQDKIRWKEILDSNLSKADSLKLSKHFITKLFSLIQNHSIEIQKKVK